jgi:hypothetical protein
LLNGSVYEYTQKVPIQVAKIIAGISNKPWLILKVISKSARPLYIETPTNIPMTTACDTRNTGAIMPNINTLISGTSNNNPLCTKYTKNPCNPTLSDLIFVTV